MSEFVAYGSEPLTPLERLVRKAGIGYWPPFVFYVFLILMFDFGFLYVAPTMYGQGFAKTLSKQFFNPILVIANSIAILFCAWFVRYQSHRYVDTLSNTCRLLFFPRGEVFRARSTLGKLLVHVLWRRPYDWLIDHRCIENLILIILTAIVPLFAIWLFPLSISYWRVLLCLLIMVVVNWFISVVAWNPPSQYNGMNRNLWLTFRSKQASSVTILGVSTAFALGTWVTHIPTMRLEAAKIGMVPHLVWWFDFPLIFATNIVYLPLTVLLVNIAYTVSSVANGIIFLCQRRYVMLLDPLDESGCGGLKPFGVLLERNTYAVGFVMFVLLASHFFVFPPDLSDPYLLYLLIGSSVLLFFSYLVPTLMLHETIKTLKLEWLRKIRLEAWAEFSKEEESSSTERARSVLISPTWTDGYSTIRSISEWPGSIPALIKLIVAWIAPFVTPLVGVSSDPQKLLSLLSKLLLPKGY